MAKAAEVEVLVPRAQASQPMVRLELVAWDCHGMEFTMLVEAEGPETALTHLGLAA
jgi:hypothetical protein